MRQNDSVAQRLSKGMGESSNINDIPLYEPLLQSKSIYDTILEDLASVFQYETGFYINGKRSFNVHNCAYCTILIGIMLLIISITLFAPLISGETVFAEVKIYSFNTPADIPI